MANRHKRFRSGGRAVHGPIHAGASSPVVKSARQGTHGFEVGGAVGGKAKATAVRRARGGSVFSKAASSLRGSGGHAGAPKHGGGRGKFALGGTVTPQLAKGGQVKTRRHGGKCEDDEDDDEEEEEEGHARGGRARHRAEGGRDLEVEYGQTGMPGGHWEKLDSPSDESGRPPYKRGGRAKKKEGMHYWAKGGRS